MSDLIGQTVAGYPIERAIGKGSYTQVYQAATSSSPLSVRLLREDLRGDTRLTQAIVRGWEAARAVTHASLVSIFSAGIDPQHGAYCLEELIEGKPLRAQVLQGMKVSWRDLLIIAEQLFQGLQELHAAGKVHGDVWPGCMIITQDQDLKLEGAGGLAQIERLVTDIIKPPMTGYFAPERLLGCPASPAADLYGAGVSLYFILAGQDPLTGDAKAVVERQLPPISTFRTDVPREAEEFLERLCAKDPTRRYGAVQDVLTDLAQLKSGKALAPLKGGKAVQPPAQPAPAAHSPARSTPGTRGIAGAGGSGLHGKKVSSIGAAVKDVGAGIKAFGHLDTQVKSTIPRSDIEKRGDDYYRQGQLPLALSCWREAHESGEPHTALKVKMELAERDIKRESYNMAIEDARQRARSDDHKGALAKAREAILSAENEEQRQAAIRIEEQAAVGIKASEKANSMKFAIAIVAFVAVAAAIFIFFGKKDDPEPDKKKAPLPTAGVENKNKLYFPDAAAFITRVEGWEPTLAADRKSLGSLRVGPDAEHPKAMMKIFAAPAGKTVAAIFADAKSNVVPNATEASFVDGEDEMSAVDGTYTAAWALVHHKKSESESATKYLFIVGGPKDPDPAKAVYLVEFEGEDTAFDAELRLQALQMMRTWTYQK